MKLTTYQMEIVKQLIGKDYLHVIRRGSIEHKALIALQKKGIVKTADNKNFVLAQPIQITVTPED